MNKRNNLTETYLKQVSALLPHAYRRNFCNDMRPVITQYISDNPDATIPALYGEFGTPKEIESSYVTSLDDNDVRHIKTRNHIMSAVVLCVIVLLLAGTYLFTKWQKDSTMVYYSETMEVITPES